MSNFQVSDPAVSQRLFDSWHTIVNLLSEFLKIPVAEVLFCHDDYTEVVCSNRNGRQQNVIDSYHADIVNQMVLQSKSHVSADGFVHGEFRKNNNTVWFCGVALFNPYAQQFGLLFIADTKRRRLNELQYQLLNNHKLTIEIQLKTELQAEELHLLRHQQTESPQLNAKHYRALSKTLSQEIIKRRNIEEQLHYHKLHDPGTGFLNHFALEAELRNHLVQKHNPTPLAIIHIGFNNARNLQSQFGHRKWETLLTQYRNRINDVDKQVDIYTARPNSTDLVLLIKTDHLINHIERICEQLVWINKSEFTIDNQVIHLHSSIGITTSAESQSPNELLEQAYSAMLSCNDSGLTCCYYSQAQAESQTHLHQVENYLLQAVRNGDLMLYFQPKVCPVSRRWTGAEALLRWRHPLLGEISTETLIHLAEKNGLIFEVGSFVLRTAIEKASQWFGHVEDFKMAVNISAKQLKDVRFVEQIKQLLKEYQLPAHYLEIEVTESGLITDEKMASDILQVLHELGVTLSLDDFGTGYASFNYLKKFPFDCIKIDKSFIHPLEYSDDDKEIVRSIIRVAKKLRLQVIIEGVETQAQEAFVINEGCDFGQGFLYGHPMPAEDFEDALLGQYQASEISWTH